MKSEFIMAYFCDLITAYTTVWTGIKDYYVFPCAWLQVCNQYLDVDVQLY